tara:strand:- start:154 stop:471 length:318 start_codon:yes stop_codon:yes gene_type:complete
MNQKYISIESAVIIQNKANSIIKLCESQISGFLLKQLFLKKPFLNQLIMEELELEFIDDEGFDDTIDIDDILADKKEINKFCTSCGMKNRVQFKFCISCGKALIN